MNQTRLKGMALLLCSLLLVGISLAILFKQSTEQEILQIQTDLLLEQMEKGETQWIPEINLNEIGNTLYGEEESVDIITLPYEETERNPIQKTPIQAPNNQRLEALGILEIEAIDLKLPISYGASQNSLKISPGWIPQTAPIGNVGNAVIVGHRNYKYGSQFNRLGEVKKGDRIAYTHGEQKQTYQVTEILEVLPDDSSPFYPVEDQSMLTLYTCTPVKTATHRLVIRASLLNS